MATMKKTSDIHALRERITTVRAEMDQVAQAAVPLTDALAAMDTFLDRLAAMYSPPVALLFADDPQPGLDSAPLLFGHPQDAHAPWVRAAAVQGDQLRAVWRAQLERAYADDPALQHPVSRDARGSRLEALQRQLDALELDEEEAIVQLELRGQQVDRRSDARADVLFDERVLRLEPEPGPSAA